MAASDKHVFNNKGGSFLLSGISAAAVTADLMPGGAMAFLSGWESGEAMYLTITDASSNIEVVKVTDIYQDQLTVVRGQDNSTARIWPAGAVVAQRLTASDLGNFIQKIAFRSVTYNPNGVLTGAFDGEKVYQTGYNACQIRWWKNTGGGTQWRLIAGAKCSEDTEDSDGYVFSPDVVVLLHFEGDSILETGWLHTVSRDDSTQDEQSTDHEAFGTKSYHVEGYLY